MAIRGNVPSRRLPPSDLTTLTEATRQLEVDLRLQGAAIKDDSRRKDDRLGELQRELQSQGARFEAALEIVRKEASQREEALRNDLRSRGGEIETLRAQVSTLLQAISKK